MNTTELAIEYVTAGWPVIPLAPKSKSPPEGMRWRHDALCDADGVRLWYSTRPDDGVAIRADRLIIVDIDNKGPEPDEIVAWLEDAHGLPPTRMQYSGGGGRHYFYAAPDGVPLRRRITWRVAWEHHYPIDLLCGPGNYVVAEPSTHPATGNRYAWALDADDGGPLPVAPAPAWLVDACRRPPAVGREGRPGGDGERLDGQTLQTWRGYYERTAGEIITRVVAAERGTRHAVACAAGIQMGGLVAAGFVTADDAMGALIDATRDGGWDDLRKTLVAFETGFDKAQPWAPPVPLHTDADDPGRGAVVVPIRAADGLPADAVGPADAVVQADEVVEQTTPCGVDRHFASSSEVVIARQLVADLEIATVPGGLVYDEGSVYRYDPVTGVWAELHPHTIRRQVARYDGCKYGSKGRRLALGNGKIKGVQAIAADWMAAPGWFEGAPAGVLCRNGFLTVEGDRVRHLPHSAEHRARWGLGFDYDPEATCPRWLQYLEEVFHTTDDDAGAANAAALARTVREFFGSALFGIGTRWQVACVLVGAGANGKSVMLDVIRRMFPADAVSSIAPQKLSHEYSIAALAGKAINICNEVPNADVLSSEIFKSCISGDPVQGRRPYQPSMTVIPKASHVYSANELPGSSDQTHGYWRRFCVIPFDRRFAPAEADDRLPERLAAEQPGILRWAVQGARSALRAGQLYQGARSAAALVDWQVTADKVRTWLEGDTVDRIDDPAKGMAPAALYSAFAAWSDRNGYRRITSASFYRRLRALDVPWTRAGSRKYALVAEQLYGA